MTDQTDDLDADVQFESDGAAAGAAVAGSGPLVFIMETALGDLNTHAAAEPEHEIGGILVGSVTDGDRPVVFVEAAIRGANMAHTRGSVTFTHETWNDINSIKDEKYPDLKIVGWYHSHPGFGLFLSGHDLFIHRNFFSAPWQVAVVADPLARTWGCFTWHGSELAQEPQVHTVAVQWSPDDSTAAPAAASPRPAPVIIQAPEAVPPSRGLNWALGMLALMLAILIGVALANYRDVILLRGQIRTLSAQVVTMSHELTVVRDRVLDLRAQPPAGADATHPTPGAAATSAPGAEPQPPSGATDSGPPAS